MACANDDFIPHAIFIFNVSCRSSNNQEKFVYFKSSSFFLYVFL